MLLIASDSTRGRRDYGVSNATPEALRWFAANNFSPLHRMIHALACEVTLGKRAHVKTIVGEDGAVDWERNFTTTHTAADMIRHLCSTHSGIVEAVIGWVMKAHGVKKGVFMILNELGSYNAYQTARWDQ
jgi:hypothetical protein